MKEIFILKGLDCPNCAAKIEREIAQKEYVTASSLNLIQQTLTVEYREIDAQKLFDAVLDVVNSHEPDVEVLPKHDGGHGHSHLHTHEHSQSENERGKILRLILGGLLFAIGVIISFFLNAPAALKLAVLVVAYVILGIDVVLNALRNITKGRIFDENFLMSISSIGAFIIGEHHEAVAVMLFYQIGEFFQDMAVDKSRRSINKLMDIRPDYANLKRDGKFVTVDPQTVLVGDTVMVKAGEKFPLDGIVTEGQSTVDTKALTGEALPKTVQVGDEVLSGCINQSGLLLIRVTKPYGQSTVAKILDMVENASSKKAPTESFITKFARYYTPVVVILAALLAIVPPLVLGGGWANWINRAFVFLVVSCPCALVISVPLAFFGGIGAASRHGILVKGGNYLEALNNVSLAAFDKTGTLTKGVFRVTEVLPENGFTSAELLKYAAFAESFSNHPIAKSVIMAYGNNIVKSAVSNYTEFSGKGVSIKTDNKKITVGNLALMRDVGVFPSPCEFAGTKVYVAVDNTAAGCIVIADEIKPQAKQALEALKKAGVQKTVMLTGDDESVAGDVARKLGLDEYRARLLPNEKVTVFESLNSQKAKNGKTVFVGDGINDAPVLARADVGVAMGGLGSDAAIEAADVVLMTDEINKLAEAINISRETKRIVIQNIVFALTVKGIFLALGALGLAGMWEAVFGDVGVALIAVLNSMRILKK